MKYSVQLPTRYGDFIMNRNDYHQPVAILRTGAPHIDAEIQLILSLADLLPAGALAIDAGANIGLVSIPLAQRLAAKGGRVLAFEPQRLIYYMLAGNTALAGLENLICQQLAPGDAESTVMVPRLDPQVGQDFGMVSLVGSGSGDEGDPVLQVTIDTLGLNQLDFLKIDVEHMELAVLNGAAATIERFSPMIWIEVWPEHYREIHAWLLARGYTMYIADDLNFCAVPHARQEEFQIDGDVFDGINHPSWRCLDDGSYLHVSNIPEETA